MKKFNFGNKPNNINVSLTEKQYASLAELVEMHLGDLIDAQKTNPRFSSNWQSDIDLYANLKQVFSKR